MAKMLNLRGSNYEAIEKVPGAAKVAGEYEVNNEVNGFYFTDYSAAQLAASEKATLITKADRVEVQKTTGETWTPGEAIYWDPAGPNLATNIAGALDIIGYAIDDRAAAATVGLISFDGIAAFLKV